MSKMLAELGEKPPGAAAEATCWRRSNWFSLFASRLPGWCPCPPAAPASDER